MEENIVSRILKGIGIGAIILGVIVSLINGIKAESMVLTIGGIAGGFISGMLFIGFSEIISLLQQEIDNQSIIIKVLKGKTQFAKEVKTDKSNHQQQESSSVIMSPNSKHLFRCVNCDQKIEKYPCENCGYKFN